jgi:hypothetical protein
MNVESLLTFIYGKLVELSGVEVYQDKVPEEESPANSYIVFSLTIPDRIREQEQASLEVDFWVEGSDIASLEALVSKVDGNSHFSNPTGLDELKYFADGLQVVFYRVFRGAVPDPDPNIIRRQLRYLARIRFIREGE